MYRFGVASKGARLSAAALAFGFLVGTGSARAETVVFRGQSPLNSAAWAPQDGFTFSFGWADNFGRDTRDAPYLIQNTASVYVASGDFAFDSISLGGWPWENFDIGAGDVLLPIYFYGRTGSAIERLVKVARGNDYTVFSERIEGVTMVQLGSADFPTNGGGIRLNSMTINSPVPEPVAIFLALAGVAATGCMRRFAR